MTAQNLSTVCNVTGAVAFIYPTGQSAVLTCNGKRARVRKLTMLLLST